MFFIAFFSGILFLLKKTHTYMGGFKSALLEFVKFQNSQQLQLQERMEKLLIQTQKKNQKKSEKKEREYQQKQFDYQQKQLEYQKEMEQKQLKYQKEMDEKHLEFQKQVLKLTTCRNSTENEFSFSQNTIRRAIENFS